MEHYSQYDMAHGMLLVGACFALLVLVMMIVWSFRLVRYLVAQDKSIAGGEPLDIASEIADILKQMILWVFGYRGEERERVAIADVDLNWVTKYRVSIFMRLFPVYAFYILSLVVLTRPVFYDNGAYRVFKYSDNPHQLFFLLAIYVSSNILFDYMSLRYTLLHVMEAIKSKRFIYCFYKDTLIALILFIFSQTISCVLWYLKRENPGFPNLDSNLLNDFFTITFWPYAFVSGQGGSEIISPLFPGQLIITGTVFFPTLILAVVFITFSTFLAATRYIKSFLRSKNLDRICRFFLRVHLVGMFNPVGVKGQFGYCNYAFMALLNICFIAMIGAIFSRFLSSS